MLVSLPRKLALQMSRCCNCKWCFWCTCNLFRLFCETLSLISRTDLVSLETFSKDHLYNHNCLKFRLLLWLHCTLILDKTQVIHTLLILFQATVLLVAFNSHNKALLTVMMSNNVSTLSIVLQTSYHNIMEVIKPPPQKKNVIIIITYWYG